MKYLFALFVVFFLGMLESHSQIDRCATPHLIRELLIDPDNLIINNQLQLDIENYIHNGEYYEDYDYYNSASLYRLSSSGEIITIPVVVHIIGNNANNIITDNLVAGQIEILNNDFRRIYGTSGNGTGADTQIKFCLTTFDENGSTTSGINRISGSYGPFAGNSVDDISIKSLINWDPTMYLNLWVVEMIPGLFGYTYGTVFLNTVNEWRDGVVVNYENFGPNSLHSTINQGRTATHEIGHWLGLDHTFSDNDFCECCTDNIEDTPFCSYPYQSTLADQCPSREDCNAQNDLAGLTRRRMIENYMDYSDDACMNMFTEGQKQRMLATLFTLRTSLFFSEGSCDSEPLFPPHCTNGVRDGDEVGMDCGGSCPPCNYPLSYHVGCSINEHYNPAVACVPRHRWMNIYGCLNGATNGPSRVLYSDNYNIGTRAFHFTSGKVSIYADCNTANNPNTSPIPIQSGRINLIDGFKFNATAQNEIRFIIQDLAEWELQVNPYKCPRSTAQACPSNQSYRTSKIIDNTLEKESAKSVIVVFPNPVSEVLNVTLNEKHVIQWELYDNTNRLVSSGFANSDFSIDFYKYMNGVYFLRLFDSEKFHVMRIVHLKL